MFRSSSKSKSLKLKRETVRVLASADLKSAQGGGTVMYLSNNDDDNDPCWIDQIRVPGRLGSVGGTGACTGHLTFTNTGVINPIFRP